jgi:hypothetical protein
MIFELSLADHDKEEEGIAIKNYKITQDGKRVYDHILAF